MQCAAQLYYAHGARRRARRVRHRQLLHAQLPGARRHRDQDSAASRRPRRTTCSRTEFIDLEDRTSAARPHAAGRAADVLPAGLQLRQRAGHRRRDRQRRFKRLWKILMLESARYLERAQASPNPDSYVSKQNVMQAVEDLQYNLSTNCTGMANVITPLIYAELDFSSSGSSCTRRSCSTWCPSGAPGGRSSRARRRGMKHARPKATRPLQQGALGYDDHPVDRRLQPGDVRGRRGFSAFISNVDAFITTQSILQESADRRPQKTAEHDEDEPPDGRHAARR